MTEHTENRRRIRRARNALATFAAEGNYGPWAKMHKGDKDDMVTDLLTDLRHYCKSAGVSFDDAVRKAADHYGEEV